MILRRLIAFVSLSLALVSCATPPSNNHATLEAEANYWQGVGSPLDKVLSRPASQPSLATTSTGTPVAAWQETNTSDDVFVRRFTSGSWQALGLALDRVGNQNATEAAIAVNVLGEPTVSWTETTVSSAKNIYAKYWNGSSWVNLATSSTW